MFTAPVALPSPRSPNPRRRARKCWFACMPAGSIAPISGMTKGHAHGSAGGVGTVLGMEWAGEVAELGPEARGVKIGDRIMGSGGAAFAEYTLADHGRLFRSPSNMNFEEAATLPVALATMHNAVVTNGASAAGPDRPRSGRKLRRRLDGNADRKTQGREDRDRLFDRCDAARAPEGIRRRPRSGFQRSRLGRIQC